MHRRTILGTGMAAVAVAATGAAWGETAHDAAVRALAAARREAGLGPLAPAPALARAARRHARQMAAAGQVSHLGRAGEDPATRARQAGHEGAVLGETLAETRDDATSTVASWLAHPATRDVLLDPAARVYGLAVAEGPDGRIWWDLVTGEAAA
jgi:uncharacterized protein YkwD